MSINWNPGIDVESVQLSTPFTTPILGDTNPLTKKSGNTSFTSYYLPSNSYMNPSILRVSRKQEANLYSGSTLLDAARIPDNRTATIEYMTIDNSTVQCDSEKSCTPKVMPTRCWLGFQAALFDIGANKDKINLYLTMLLGATLDKIPRYEFTDGGMTYSVFDFAQTVRGNTDILRDEISDSNDD
jgi:hypothetical protein